MSDEHQHLVRYTVTMRARHWWGGRVTLYIVGKGSSKKDDELLIFLPNGGFYSVNFGRVLWMTAMPIEHNHEG